MEIDFVGLVMGLVLGGVGSVLNTENAPSMLAGYNTMDKDELVNVDFVGLTKVTKQGIYGMAIICAGFSLVVTVLSPWYDLSMFSALVCAFVVCWGSAWVMLRSKKYDLNIYPRWKRIFHFVALIFTILFPIVLPFLIFLSNSNLV